MIRKNLSAIVFAIATTIGTGAFAQQAVEGDRRTLPTNEPKFMQGGYLILKGMSSNVFDIGLKVNSGAVAQTILGLNFDGGWNVEYFISTPVNVSEFNEKYSEEDLTLTKRWHIGDYDLSSGIAVYDLDDVGTIDKGDFVVLVNEIDRTWKIDDLKLTSYFLTKTNFSRGYECGGDTVVYGGVKGVKQVNETLAIAARTALVYNPGIAGTDPGLMANVDLGFQWKLGDWTFEAPGLHAALPICGAADMQNQFWLGVSATFNF